MQSKAIFLLRFIAILIDFNWMLLDACGCLWLWMIFDDLGKSGTEDFNAVQILGSYMRIDSVASQPQDKEYHQ